MSSVPEFIHQAIIKENHNFQKVIVGVADGFKRCGFFDQEDWKNSLEQGFGQTRLGLTSAEINIYSSVLSDSSYEAAFVNGLVGPSSESTPVAGPGPGQKAKDNQMPRIKRASTSIIEGTSRDTAKKFRKASTTARKTVVDNNLVDLRKTDWSKVVPAVNAKQMSVTFETVFERSKQLRGSPSNPRPQTVTSSSTVTASSTVTTTTTVTASATVTTLPALNSSPAVQNTQSRIKTRRNAIYRPPVKKGDNSVKVSVPLSMVPVVGPVLTVSKTVPSTKPPAMAAATLTAAPGNDVVLSNITNRRTTRLQTKLLAAYSGNAVSRTSERRSTTVYQRTSVLFTMIHTSLYKDVFQTYNIFVADRNDKYDYMIAERICRSPKFLSAVVSGKPIVSLDWIHALKEQKLWLDPLGFLLKDDDGEKENDFNLSATLQKASDRRLFENYSIVVTPKISISPEQLKDVIFSGGGKYLKTTLLPRKGDEVICVSDEKDKQMWPKILAKYPQLKQIISLDGFAEMIFKYSYNVTSRNILHQD